MLLLMLGTAISEMISLGAVLPFIGVLTAPDKVLKYRLISQLAEIFGINSPDQLVTPLAIGFAFTALIAGCMRLLLLWASARLSNSIGADLSSEMYRRTLYQPYRVHAVRNSSEVIDGITNKSWIAMSMLQAVLTLTSSILLLLGLMVALLAIDLFIVSLAFVVFGVSYGLITWVARRKLEANSQLIARQSASAVKALQEGLGAIRDVLLNWTQPVYCETYREADVPYRQAYGSNMFIAVSP
ncbi:MAG: ABC transporter transmembrane domain-containing protein, partial [Desulfomonilaceae bacterium]